MHPRLFIYLFLAIIVSTSLGFAWLELGWAVTICLKLCRFEDNRKRHSTSIFLYSLMGLDGGGDNPWMGDFPIPAIVDNPEVG